MMMMTFIVLQICRPVGMQGGGGLEGWGRERREGGSREAGNWESYSLFPAAYNYSYVLVPTSHQSTSSEILNGSKSVLLVLETETGSWRSHALIVFVLLIVFYAHSPDSCSP